MNPLKHGLKLVNELLERAERDQNRAAAMTERESPETFAARNAKRLSLRCPRGVSVADHMQSLSDEDREIFWRDYQDQLSGGSGLC